MVFEEKILECLSEGIKNKLAEYQFINEIRMRKNSPLLLTLNNKNITTEYIVTPEDIEYSVIRFCKNSVHTYFESMKKGFIPFFDGYRIGVCGDAVVDKDRIINISEITSLNIRLPSQNPEIPFELLKNIRCEKGLLCFSPAGYGKTTVLKGIIKLLSTPPFNKRISVIDTRKEIYSEKIHYHCPVDIFSGYPKVDGIDIAVRSMSPEVIVCDEIGVNDETDALINAKMCGVSLICTAHAQNIKELLSRKNIRKMHEYRTFEGYLGIRLINGKRVYNYTKYEDVIV